MTVPDFQTLTLPLLREFADGAEHASKDIRARVAENLKLSPEDLSEVLANGRQTRFTNRMAWALVYMKQAALVESVRRGVYRITARGKEVLSSPPPKITVQFLTRYPEFLEFRARSAASEDVEPTPSGQVPAAMPEAVVLTPDEQLRSAYQRLRIALAAQLLDRVRQASPEFFETLVVRVLVAMGYGGSEEDAARVVGRSGDGGIDGIIKEDRLGLESIYIQAKRWGDGKTVGRPDIQQFAGALQGQRARKGVFITTAAFSRDATDYAKGLQNTIVLVDGPQFAELMIEYGVGLSEVQTIKLWKLDEDYFLEE